MSVLILFMRMHVKFPLRVSKMLLIEEGEKKVPHAVSNHLTDFPGSLPESRKCQDSLATKRKQSTHSSLRGSPIRIVGKCLY